MLQPTTNMAATGVMVRPVENATFFIPLVFATKRDGVPSAQAADPRSQINVMRDQQRLAVTEPQDEPLMSRSLVVIRQYLD